MARNRVMRVAALALAVVILPLAVFAAVSLGLRLNQYGLAPERLWGMVAVIVTCVWGVGYWLALILGRNLLGRCPVISVYRDEGAIGLVCKPA